ncbi:hypothetical protein SL1157_2302 [Ruegeria lacuscaerulensis ITI-1157]|nr:hypothetical protein SL1157_2302 [Ruegeria lacuscaerulensis ITI-1157]
MAPTERPVAGYGVGTVWQVVVPVSRAGARGQPLALPGIFGAR